MRGNSHTICASAVAVVAVQHSWIEICDTGTSDDAIHHKLCKWNSLECCEPEFVECW